MKRWIIAGTAVSLLLIITFVALFGFFFSDLASAFSPETTAPSTATQLTTVPETTVTEPTTVPEETTLPPETTLPEETTLPPETTLPEETTMPATTAPPVTTAPPATTAPPETTTPPATTAPPETTTPPTTQEDIQGISLTAHHAFVYDISSGTYLFTKGNLDDALHPASLTKLFSVYVALQHMPLETVLTAGEEVNWIDPDSSRAWIYADQQLTVQTCIEGMLLPSGNDAAYILAVGTGRVLLGDPQASAESALAAFIAEMNAQAQTLGLTGSHFANPDGIDADDHYISPRDMCTIAQLALSNQTISRCAATTSTTAYYVSGESVFWRNSNRLLHPESSYYCPDACGLKTGHTDDAGWCLLSAFHSEDKLLIIGILGCDTMDIRDAEVLTLYENFK